jgi:hypothetical protein
MNKIKEQALHGSLLLMPTPWQVSINCTNVRPNRTSLKCDCKFSVSAAHPKREDATRDPNIVEVIGLQLENTSGCLGNDGDMNFALKQGQGRKYDGLMVHEKLVGSVPIIGEL